MLDTWLITDCHILIPQLADTESSDEEDSDSEPDVVEICLSEDEDEETEGENEQKQGKQKVSEIVRNSSKKPTVIQVESGDGEITDSSSGE